MTDLSYELDTDLLQVRPHPSVKSIWVHTEIASIHINLETDEGGLVLDVWRPEPQGVVYDFSPVYSAVLDSWNLGCDDEDNDL